MTTAALIALHKEFTPASSSSVMYVTYTVYGSGYPARTLRAAVPIADISSIRDLETVEQHIRKELGDVECRLLRIDVLSWVSLRADNPMETGGTA